MGEVVDVEGTGEFHGRVAFVTGGTRGIGRATALEFAARGADVAFTYWRRRSAARQVVAEIEERGGRAVAVRMDAADKSQVDEAFETVGARLGRLDYYVNNAASAIMRPLLRLGEPHWQYSIDTNVTAALNACRSAYRLMPESRGAIVLMSSLGSRKVMEGYGAMGVCKAAIESLGRYLAVELAPGVNVNTVCGGLIDTDSVQALRNAEELVRQSEALAPLGRIGHPDDLAKVAVFLCTDDAEWIRGQTIVADGGASLVS